jgi:hypothetical protein
VADARVSGESKRVGHFERAKRVLEEEEKILTRVQGKKQGSAMAVRQMMKRS